MPYKLPPLDKTLIERFEEACQEFKNKPAFISFGKKLSYEELRSQSLNFAGYLQNKNLKKGDVFVIMLPNLFQYPISFWGAIRAGLTVVNMNPLYTAREMLRPIQETRAKGIILLSNKLNALKGVLDKTKLQSVIVTDPGDLLSFPKKQIINLIFKHKTKTLFQQNRHFGSSHRPASHSHYSLNKQTKNFYNPNCISFLEALQEGSKTKTQIQKRDFKETTLIQYTGGTTGTIKGACLSHKNIVSNLNQCELWMLSHLKKGEEQALTALPLYHIFAFLVNGLVFFLNGFTNVLIANPRQINSLIKTIKKQKITVGTGVNTLFKALLKQNQFKNLDFSHWKLFIAGGMSLESSVQKMWQSITQSSLVEGYGLTETSPVVCVNRLDKPAQGFAGYPLPSTEIRIKNEQGQELGIDQKGELEVRGPQVMEKYYKQDKETQLVLDKEAWLKTGDIAKVNSEGLIQIIDRKKDMINISGLKVYPNEVEDVLAGFKKIQESAVVSGKDRQGMEIVKAFVIKRQSDLSEKELISYCKKHLAPYKVPKQIEFVDHIPKSIIGKPLRRLLQ